MIEPTLIEPTFLEKIRRFIGTVVWEAYVWVSGGSEEGVLLILYEQVRANYDEVFRIYREKNHEKYT